MTFLEKMFLVIACLSFMMITGIAKANPVTEWFKTEWVKTVEFQKESWEEGKEQVSNNKLQIQELWNKVKDNVTQD